MKKKFLHSNWFLPVMMLCCISCKKDWLDAKPDISLATPNSVSDLQALLDNAFNDGGNNINSPVLGQLGSDEYYLTSANWMAGDPYARNAYIWAGGDNFYQGDDNIGDWLFSYKTLLTTNIVLDAIDGLEVKGTNEMAAADNVKGQALFLRAYKHYALAQLFCKPFQQSTARTDPGIPLRLNSDLTTTSKRSSVFDTYQQIVSDLLQARKLLSSTVTNNITSKVRTSKVAADAMLGRVYLSMSSYDSALYFANKGLEAYPDLMDYNDDTLVLLGEPFPFKIFNREVIYHQQVALVLYLFPGFLQVDTSLYRLYDPADLRKDAFFSVTDHVINYRGSYTGSFEYFEGLTSAELYLIRAECYARLGQPGKAAENLNALLVNRYRKENFTPIGVSDVKTLLDLTLAERRKELCFRNLRWSDLRRLNLSPEYAVTLKPVLDGNVYTLPPNDKRYVLPLPANVIRLSGMEQNPR